MKDKIFGRLTGSMYRKVNIDVDQRSHKGHFEIK